MKREPLSDAERSRNRMARLKARAEAAQEMGCLFADILCAPSLKHAREIARRGMALSDASRLDRAAVARASLCWPHNCIKPGSCARNRACMYAGCQNEGRDIAGEVDAEEARRVASRRVV